jgi:Omp85 superfamily domain
MTNRFLLSKYTKRCAGPVTGRSAHRQLAFVLLLTCAIGAAARAQEKPSAPAEPESDAAKSQNTNPPSDPKKGEWVYAPIPVNSPALGAGLAWAVGYVSSLNKNDTVSPPSIIGTAGLYTNNGSRGIAFGAKLYLKEDKYRLAMAVGHASVNAELYGVGLRAGERGLFLPINTKGSAFFGESLFRLRKGMYLGPRFQYRNLRLSIDRENSDLPGDIVENPPPEVADIVDAIREDLFRQKTIAIGPRFQFDTRDNTFYPKSGVFVDSGIDLFAKALGSKFTYQYVKFAFNRYASVGEHGVLAVRGMACAATGDRVPIYDLCLFGARNDLRGYSAGRFQDRRMFATQAEYRLVIPKTGFLGRFGLVGFGGVGAVAPKFSDMTISDMLPGGGGGVRFRLTKKHPINFRVDYGFGKTGRTLSIGVGEAF